MRTNLMAAMGLGNMKGNQPTQRRFTRAAASNGEGLDDTQNSTPLAEKEKALAVKRDLAKRSFVTEFGKTKRYFDLTSDGAEAPVVKVKTGTSKRRVPVHPTLLKMGLLRVIKEIFMPLIRVSNDRHSLIVESQHYQSPPFGTSCHMHMYGAKSLPQFRAALGADW